MYDHESADLSRLLYLWTMPRVVEDQREKFQSDDFFIKLSRQTEVKYTKLPHAPEAERRAQFNQDCQEGRIPITFLPSGFNLDLSLVREGEEAPSTSQESTSSLNNQDSSQDPNEVRISSPVILNGVCVRWKGKISRTSLRGQGCLEFDDSRAEEEKRMLRSEMQLLGETFRQLERQFLPPPISQNHGAEPPVTSVSPAVTTTSS